MTTVLVPALRHAHADYGNTALPHLKLVGGGISALNPTLWLREDAGLDLGHHDKLFGWESEVGGHNATISNLFETSYSQHVETAPQYQRTSHAVRFGLNAAGDAVRPGGLYVPNAAGHDLGLGAGRKLCIGLRLQVLPPVAPFGDATAQFLLFHGFGDGVASTDADYCVYVTYNSGATAFITLSVFANNDLTIASSAFKSGVATVIFYVVQDTLNSGTMYGYVNGVLAGTQAYASKLDPAPSVYPTLIGRKYLDLGLEEYLLADLYSLQINQFAMDAAAIATLHNGMAGVMPLSGTTSIEDVPRNVRTETGDYTILSTDRVVISLGTGTKTLPDSDLMPGEIITLIKGDDDATTMTWATQGGQLVDDELTTDVLTVDDSSIDFLAVDGNWRIK